MKERTDKERIDALQKLSIGYGDGWILRDSSNGRGMRLHETTLYGAVLDIRIAIDRYLDAVIEEEENE